MNNREKYFEKELLHYEELFRKCHLEVATLVAIRDIARMYRDSIFQKYKVKSEKELRRFYDSWGDYEEAIQICYLRECEEILKIIPDIPDSLINMGITAEIEKRLVDGKAGDAGKMDK